MKRFQNVLAWALIMTAIGIGLATAIAGGPRKAQTGGPFVPPPTCTEIGMRYGCSTTLGDLPTGTTATSVDFTTTSIVNGHSDTTGVTLFHLPDGTTFFCIPTDGNTFMLGNPTDGTFTLPNQWASDCNFQDTYTVTFWSSDPPATVCAKLQPCTSN